MNNHSGLFGQFAPSPHVVIAREKMHLNAAFGDMSDGAEQLFVLFLTLVFPEVLIPEIEHIAQQVNCTGIAAHVLEQFDHFCLMVGTVRKRAGT